MSTAPPLAAAAAAAPTGADRHRLSPAWRGLWLGLLGVALFALTIPMTRLASGTALAPRLPPEFIAIGRAALAGVLAAAWLRWQRAPWPRRSQCPWLAACASGVVFGFPLGLGFAVPLVPAAHAAVVTGLLPLATALLGALLMRQRPSWGFWACAAAGTALVIGYAGWKGGATLHLADAWLLCAVAMGGVGYVCGARLSAPSGDGGAPMVPEQVISWVLVLCLPLTLPLALAWMPAAARWQALPGSAWLGFGYVSLVSMWLGFFAWYRALAIGGVMRVSQIQLLQPFLSILLAVPLLGEALDAPTAAVALAVMATVGLSRRMAVHRPAPVSSPVPAHETLRRQP